MRERINHGRHGKHGNGGDVVENKGRTMKDERGTMN